MTNAKRRREKRAKEKVPGQAGEPSPFGSRERRRAMARDERQKATVARKQQKAWDSWQRRKAGREAKAA